MVTPRKGVPIWAWIISVPVLLYLALWGGTAVAGARHLRQLRTDWCSNRDGKMLVLTTFDPTASRPMVSRDDDRLYAFVGNFTCPCPLVVSEDIVVYGREGGLAVRHREVLLGKRWEQLSSLCYWSY